MQEMALEKCQAVLPAGRGFTAADVFDPIVQRGIADELWRLHHLEPAGLPEATFFELLHDK